VGTEELRTASHGKRHLRLEEVVHDRMWERVLQPDGTPGPAV